MIGAPGECEKTNLGGGSIKTHLGSENSMTFGGDQERNDRVIVKLGSLIGAHTGTSPRGSKVVGEPSRRGGFPWGQATIVPHSIPTQGAFRSQEGNVDKGSCGSTAIRNWQA